MRFTRSSTGAYFAPSALVIGDVQIGEDSSVWFNAVIRGDVAPISIGKRVNVQDCAIIHCDTGVPNVIGDDVSIAHGAIVHGMSVGDGTLVGMHATLMGRTQIGKECLIAADAMVPPGMVVPDRMCVMGLPGKIVRPVTDEELKYLRWLPQRYTDLARAYEAGKFTSFS